MGSPKGRLGLAGVGAVGVGLYTFLVRGSLTLDLGIGRSLRPLGPFSYQIAASREVVFDVISTPYLHKTLRALESKLRVLERSSNMVLAEHFTRVGPFVTTTLETVRFEPPERVHFRLVRGPVPYVVEQFVLRETTDGTELAYSGELGTDFWLVGRGWGGLVASKWEAAVRKSLATIKAEAERRTPVSRRLDSTSPRGVAS